MAVVGEPPPDGGDSVERAVEMDVDSGLTSNFKVMGPPSSPPLQKSCPPLSSHLRNSSMSASDSCSKLSSKCKNLGLENSFSTSSHKCNHSGPANLVTQSSESFATILNSSITLQKRAPLSRSVPHTKSLPQRSRDQPMASYPPNVSLEGSDPRTSDPSGDLVPSHSRSYQDP